MTSILRTSAQQRTRTHETHRAAGLEDEKLRRRSLADSAIRTGSFAKIAVRCSVKRRRALAQ